MNPEHTAVLFSLQRIHNNNEKYVMFLNGNTLNFSTMPCTIAVRVGRLNQQTLYYIDIPKFPDVFFNYIWHVASRRRLGALHMHSDALL